MKKIIFLVLIVLGTSSCLNDFLEIEPISDISSEIYWKTEKDVRAALNAGYSQMQKAYTTGGLQWFEIRADNFIGNSSGVYPFQNTTFNRIATGTPYSIWNDWYRLISIANHAIYFIPKMEDGISEEAKNQLMSEAYFLRAFAYFNLYRIWGYVPLITKPVLKKTDVYKPFQEDKDKIMELINADLVEADKLVNTTVAQVFIYSPGALYALTTDVAMWNKDYDKAILFSKKLIDLGQHTLVGQDFRLVCENGQTKDNILTLKWVYTSDGSNTYVFSSVSGNTLAPSLPIYQKWAQPEYAKDLRRVASIDTLEISKLGPNHIINHPSAKSWKWSPGRIEQQDTYRNSYIPIYRFADILLLRAEALNKKGLYTEAITEMNKVRTRAGLPNKITADYTDPITLLVDADLLENSILQERQFELFHEGKRWFDLVRTGKVMTVMNEYYETYIKAYGATSYRKLEHEWQLYWPISQDILNENENLTQTGDY